MIVDHAVCAATLEAYQRAVDGGADLQTAKDVALAKLRASFPLAHEQDLMRALPSLLGIPCAAD